jgi:hypothetical protein
MTFTYPELQKCAQRELRMREKVYAKRIEAGTMSQEEADREIGMMKEIEEILEYLSQPQLRLD